MLLFLDWNVRQAAMGTVGRTKGSQGKVNVFVFLIFNINECNKKKLLNSGIVCNEKL